MVTSSCWSMWAWRTAWVSYWSPRSSGIILSTYWLGRLSWRPSRLHFSLFDLNLSKNKIKKKCIWYLSFSLLPVPESKRLDVWSYLRCCWLPVWLCNNKDVAARRGQGVRVPHRNVPHIGRTGEMHPGLCAKRRPAGHIQGIIVCSWVLSVTERRHSARCETFPHILQQQTAASGASGSEDSERPRAEETAAPDWCAAFNWANVSTLPSLDMNVFK